MQRLVVKPETALVRPFVTAAVLRGMTFDAASYASFIDLQVLLPLFSLQSRAPIREVPELCKARATADTAAWSVQAMSLVTRCPFSQQTPMQQPEA